MTKTQVKAKLKELSEKFPKMEYVIHTEERFYSQYPDRERKTYSIDIKYYPKDAKRGEIGFFEGEGEVGGYDGIQKGGWEYAFIHALYRLTRHANTRNKVLLKQELKKLGEEKVAYCAKHEYDGCE